MNPLFQKAAKQIGPVYHGTPHVFDQFEHTTGQRTFFGLAQISVASNAFFFTPDKNIARNWAADRREDRKQPLMVLECYITLNNPVDLRTDDWAWEEVGSRPLPLDNLPDTYRQQTTKSPKVEPISLLEALRDYTEGTVDEAAWMECGIDIDKLEVVNQSNLFLLVDNKGIIDALKFLKYDGIILNETNEPELGGVSYAVFNSNQIKIVKKTKVGSSPVHEINLSNDFGSAEGYVADTDAEQLQNWLDRFNFQDEAFVADLRQKYDRFSVLNNINVYEDARGQGHGDELLGEFLEEAGSRGAGVCLLVADTAEEQAQGFNLVEWYERNDFEDLGEVVGGRLMIFGIMNPKTASKTADDANIGTVKNIITEMMGVLSPGLPTPEAKIVNQTGRTLGYDQWIWGRRADGTTFGEDNTTISVQKILLGDEQELRKVIAHELCHHEVALLIAKPKLLEVGYDTYKRYGNILGPDGHGKEWKAVASRFNAVYGENFVTERSDKSFVKQQEKPLWILLNQHAYGYNKKRLGWQWAIRLSPQMLKYLDSINWESGEYKLVRSTDSTLTRGRGQIKQWGGWNLPRTPEQEAIIDKLWTEAPMAKLAGKIAEESDYQADYNRVREERVKTYEKFIALADDQRGAPESAMLKIQHDPLGAGVYSFAVEHTGDLTHRMNERVSIIWGSFGYDSVKNKVEKVLRYMESGYGFEREMQGNLKNNYEALKDEKLKGVSYEEALAKFRAKCEVYATAHEGLVTYNRPQELCRDAAVSLGRWQFDKTRALLNTIKGLLDQGEEAWIAQAGQGADIEKTAKGGPHKASTAMIMLPSGAATKMMEVAMQIPDEELGTDGREDEPHITIKYGVKDDAELLKNAIANVKPFNVTLGKTHVFEVSESSNGQAPIVVEVHAPELAELHDTVNRIMGTRPDDFDYKPHVTLAYVRANVAAKYRGLNWCEGISFQVNGVTLSTKGGSKVPVPFTKMAAYASPSVMIARVKKKFPQGDLSVRYPTFLLPDGSIVWNPDSAESTHIEMASYGLYGRVSKTNVDAPHEFMKFTGSIRMTNGGVDIVGKPTPQQMAVIDRFAQRFGGKLYYDAGSAYGQGTVEEIEQAVRKMSSHKTPPLSDTTYRDPELGEETNAYADIPERVDGVEGVPKLEELSPDLFKTGAGSVHDLDLQDVVAWGGSLSEAQGDWDKIRAEAAKRVKAEGKDWDQMPEAEQEVWLDKIGWEWLGATWEVTLNRLQSLKFPLTVYRGLGSVSLKEINKGQYKEKGTGIYWTYDENSAYIHEELAAGHPHIVILRGTVSSPKSIDWIRTAYVNLVAADEKEINIWPGEEI